MAVVGWYMLVFRFLEYFDTFFVALVAGCVQWGLLQQVLGLHFSPGVQKHEQNVTFVVVAGIVHWGHTLKEINKSELGRKDNFLPGAFLSLSMLA